MRSSARTSAPTLRPARRVRRNASTLGAAVTVVTDDEHDEWSVREALTSLVAKSMVVDEEGPDGTTRYQLLETLRHFAREQLDVTSDPDGWRRRHAAALREPRRGTRAALHGPDELAWRPRFRAELDNLRAAVMWSLDATDDADARARAPDHRRARRGGRPGPGRGGRRMGRTSDGPGRSPRHPGSGSRCWAPPRGARGRKPTSSRRKSRALDALRDTPSADWPCPHWAYIALAMRKLLHRRGGCARGHRGGQPRPPHRRRIGAGAHAPPRRGRDAPRGGNAARHPRRGRSRVAVSPGGRQPDRAGSRARTAGPSRGTPTTPRVRSPRSTRASRSPAAVPATECSASRSRWPRNSRRALLTVASVRSPRFATPSRTASTSGTARWSISACARGFQILAALGSFDLAAVFIGIAVTGRWRTCASRTRRGPTPRTQSNVSAQRRRRTSTNTRSHAARRCRSRDLSSSRSPRSMSSSYKSGRAMR